MPPRQWQFDSRRIYVRPRTGPQSAHHWWPAVAKLQAASVPLQAASLPIGYGSCAPRAAAPWDRQTDGSRYRLMPTYGGWHNNDHCSCYGNRRRSVLSADLVEQSVQHAGTEHVACGEWQPEHVVEVRSALLLFLFNTHTSHFVFLIYQCLQYGSQDTSKYPTSPTVLFILPNRLTYVHRCMPVIPLVPSDSQTLISSLLRLSAHHLALAASALQPLKSGTLPPSLCTCTSRDTFRRHLKTHYCQQAFQST